MNWVHVQASMCQILGLSHLLLPRLPSKIQGCKAHVSKLREAKTRTSHSFAGCRNDNVQDWPNLTASFSRDGVTVELTFSSWRTKYVWMAVMLAVYTP